uniref:Uncharacterized protein n=1 Tax=Ascaris lumbricoides TaxID=6252 RepID=A0A9J2PPL8_ASCLU
MFYNRDGDIAGLDYSKIEWSNGYVPVPTHMIQSPIDRRSHGKETILSEQQYNRIESIERLIFDYTNGKNCKRGVGSVPKGMHRGSGKHRHTAKGYLFRREVEVESGAFLTRRIITPKRSHGKEPILSEQQYNRIESIERLILDYTNGKNVSETNGINLSVELPKIRPGPLTFELTNCIGIKVHITVILNIYSYLSLLRKKQFSSSEERVAACA